LHHGSPPDLCLNLGRSFRIVFLSRGVIVHRNPQNNFWEQRGWRLTVCQAWLSSCNAELRTFPTTKSIINYCIVGHKLLDGALVISINCLGTCGVTVRQSTLRLPSAQGYPIICFSPPPPKSSSTHHHNPNKQQSMGIYQTHFELPCASSRLGRRTRKKV
jgi:hypothetical protein